MVCGGPRRRGGKWSPQAQMRLCVALAEGILRVAQIPEARVMRRGDPDPPEPWRATAHHRAAERQSERLAQSKEAGVAASLLQLPPLLLGKLALLASREQLEITARQRPRAS